MIAEITKILPAEKSANGNNYVRVMFRLDGGGFAKTDLCPDYRNFKRWRTALKVGNRLGNLIMRKSDCIDADSWPIVIKQIKEIKEVNLSDPREFSKNVLC